MALLLALPRVSQLIEALPIFPTRRQWWWLKMRLLPARLRCLIRGHWLCRLPYCAPDGRIAEYHCGCLHCDLFWTQCPAGTSTAPPRLFFRGARWTLRRLRPHLPKTEATP